MRLGWFFIFGIVLIAGGCSSEETAWVSGKVTYAGKEVPDGALRFFPAEGTPGNGAGAEIVDGQYKITPEFAKKKGLMAGGYRITVVASRKTGKKIYEPDGKKLVDQYTMYLPSRYNRQTKLHAELKPGENAHDLLLEH